VFPYRRVNRNIARIYRFLIGRSVAQRRHSCGIPNARFFVKYIQPFRNRISRSRAHVAWNHRIRVHYPDFLARDFRCDLARTNASHACADLRGCVCVCFVRVCFLCYLHHVSVAMSNICRDVATACFHDVQIILRILDKCFTPRKRFVYIREIRYARDIRYGVTLNSRI